MEIIYIVLISIGLFFIFAGVIGIFRMPDTFCKLQSATNISTMGIIPIIIACSIWGFSNGDIAIGIKSIIVIIFLIITNPVASHLLARAAHKVEGTIGEKIKFNHYRREIDE